MTIAKHPCPSCGESTTLDNLCILCVRGLIDSVIRAEVRYAIPKPPKVKPQQLELVPGYNRRPELDDFS